MIEKNLMVLKMYSDYKSPYAWMAFEPCLDFAREFHVHVRWIPFQLRLKDKGARSDTTEYMVHYSYMDGRRAGNDRGIWIKGPLKIYNTRPALIGGLFAEKHGLLRQYSLEVYRRFFLREFVGDLPEPGLAQVERSTSTARVCWTMSAASRKPMRTTASACPTSSSTASRSGDMTGWTCCARR
jgi:2-hydroxychromene-2-carboxylate isomerase